MARQAALRQLRGVWSLLTGSAVVALVAGLVGLNMSGRPVSATTGPHFATTTLAATTTIKPQAGWTVVTRTHRGVVTDRRVMVIAGAPITVVRFRYGAVGFHWHGGYVDPPGATRLPFDAVDHVEWGTEGAVGVVGVFNGGFKANAHIGGIIHDGVTLEPMIKGFATLAINVNGQINVGKWGRDFPSISNPAITYRQNLPLLIDHGVLADTAARDVVQAWGSWLGKSPLVPRTGLGVNAAGDVIFAASMTGISPLQLGRALLQAGVVRGMQLDINPFWPIVGLATHPLHNSRQRFNFSLPGSKHEPSVYEVGWQRDFFVVMAEPASWSCRIATGPPSHPGKAEAHFVRFVGAKCPPRTGNL